jgi:steroid 5-alpha reductase family enzyme
MNFLKMTKKQTGYFFIGAYALTFIIGILIFLLLEDITNLDTLMTTFIANLGMTVVIFIFSLITKNSSMYDPYWSVIPPFILVGWIIYLDVQIGIGTIFILIGIFLWAIRLTYNWWKNWTGFKEQDWRYDLIKERTKGYYLLSNFGAIHLIPTLVVYLQMINVHDVIIRSAEINVWLLIGFTLMIFASVIQFIADKQMFDFRQNRKDKYACIDQGIWRYSRHPNYLGELSLWVGVYLIYISVYQKLDMNIIYPISMIMLFLFVSIPMMEKKLAIRPCYQAYKKQVSMLFPYRKRNKS